MTVGCQVTRRKLRSVLVVMAAVGAAAACGDRPAPPPAEVPTRIVSMAPSLTETLVALGLSDRIVGVTRYCPPVAGAVSVGGYFDPSYEAIVALEPDLVVLMQSHDELHRRLVELGLDTLRVDQHDIAGIVASVEAIAGRCGVESRGRELAEGLRRSLDEVARSVAGLPRPRTLVVVGREPGGARMTPLWAAAADTFYDDVIRLAGGVNAIADSSIRYPELSVEGLIAIDPDVILDVVADGGVRGIDVEAAAADWRELSEVRAVRDGRVHVLTDSFVVIPGPRIVDTVRVFAACLHPEVEW